MITVAALPTLWTRLPVGGWQVGFWVDNRGRTHVDVADLRGTLVYQGAGCRSAATSIDGGWTGWGAGTDRVTRCWALAVGHQPAGPSCPVSFVSPAGLSVAGQEQEALLPDGWTGLRITEDGLWVAAATGSPAALRPTAYSHARLTSPAGTWQYPLVSAGTA